MSRVRGRSANGAARSEMRTLRVRLDRATLVALLALGAFLGVPLHVHVHDVHVHELGAAHPAAEAHSHASGDPAAPLTALGRSSCSHEAPASAPEAPESPRDPHDDHDCPICHLAGEARASLPAEPVAPPRGEGRSAAHVPESSSAPSASLLLAARPRAPPAAA